MKRAALIISLAAVVLLATAASAFAMPDGTSGTVYGKAVLAPYAIVITGPGTDSNSPLTYEGALGQTSYEKYGNTFTVTNTGTQNALVKVDQAQAPTDGGDTWTLTGYQTGYDLAGWSFYDRERDTGASVLPPTDPWYDTSTTLNPNLPSGASESLESFFRFPTSTGSNSDHYMMATLSVTAQP